MSDPSFSIADEEILLDPQARPVVDGKYEKRSYELVFHAKKEKRVFRGVKEVKKAIRRGQKGLVFIAADTHPFDVVSAFPVSCEKAGLSYYFVRSKKMLSKASGTKQTASIVMVQQPDKTVGKEEAKSYEKLEAKAKELAAATEELIVY